MKTVSGCATCYCFYAFTYTYIICLFQNLLTSDRSGAMPIAWGWGGGGVGQTEQD